ncbi:MAG TPA: glycosyltransferase [Gemmatimonadaceae bacterium]|nr:glycosyltransferase [Gemmatimonadaceae bacterium]
MRRVLMIAPHFPPDTGAATHRVRLLAPHLAEFGWEPTVLTVDPSVNESRQDPDLAAMVPPDLDVVRAGAWSPRWTRKLGIGDLGLRAFTNLYDEAVRLLSAEKYDALFITIFPTYPALLGPLLKKKFHIPFVLDYIDPWVSAWGKDVGGGKNGTVNLKSRLTRFAALQLEPMAVRSADALTAVSARTYEMIQERIPETRGLPTAAIPYGGDETDFARLREHPRRNEWFDKNDGDFHLCYMGTLLPLGFDTLRAVLEAIGELRKSAPDTYRRTQLHFFGTSNQTTGTPDARVLPIAKEIGVGDRVTEYPLRVDYLDALMLQVDASAILLMGSSEAHYTASKLYPALLSGRPLLAVYHSASTVAEIMSEVTSPPNAYLVTYSDTDTPRNKISDIARALQSLVENPMAESITWRSDRLEMFSARSLAGELAKVFDRVSNNSRN